MPLQIKNVSPNLDPTRERSESKVRHGTESVAAVVGGVSLPTRKFFRASPELLAEIAGVYGPQTADKFGDICRAGDVSPVHALASLIVTRPKARVLDGEVVGDGLGKPVRLTFDKSKQKFP